MPETNKVVLHYLDGTIVKGSTQDFAPNRLLFHVAPLNSRETVKVRIKDLKAVYFVKDFSGSPEREDIPGFTGARQGKKIAVLFKDGELLCGTTLSYTPGRQGFFVQPADENGNNLRIYVVADSAHKVKAGPAAEKLAAEAA